MVMAADGRPFVPPFPGSSLEPPRLQLRWSLPERERERRGREALEEKGGTMICPTGIFKYHMHTHTHSSDVEMERMKGSRKERKQINQKIMKQEQIELNTLNRKDKECMTMI